MRNRVAALCLAGGAVVSMPRDALAQHIPWIVLPLAASPLVAFVLAVTLGVLSKSWRVGLANMALVSAWVGWFVAASNYTTSDLLIWASMVALGLHSLAMAWFVALHVFRRSKTGQ
jgi:hypothetical protein